MYFYFPISPARASQSACKPVARELAVARGFIPAGSRSGPKPDNSVYPWIQGLRRSPAGRCDVSLNPLATKDGVKRGCDLSPDT